MTSMHHCFWAAWCWTRLLVKLTPKGVVLPVLSFSSFHDTNADGCGVILHFVSYHETNADVCGVTLQLAKGTWSL